MERRPFVFDPGQDLIPAPDDAEDQAEYRRQLLLWRRTKRNELAYSDHLYRRPEFAWVPSNYACYFLMLNDERFWDWRRSHYRVKDLVAMGRREWGGFDSVVLWHAYPRIGLDPRNQFDFYRDMPGGIPGLRKVIDTFHRAGVRVFIDYNPWDTGTQREGRSDIEVLTEMVGSLDADGIFLDTMNEGAAEFRAKLDSVRKGVVLEGEIALPLHRVADHHLAWAQWFQDSEAPGVLRNKWFERRHVMHQIQRWNRDHTAELHTAWMNGTGMMIWDNIFGTWNGWNERDKSILRSMLPIQRRYASLFSGEGWEPLVRTLAHRVYASLWKGPGVRLWTLVNRSSSEVSGGLLETELDSGERVWDLVTGSEIEFTKRSDRFVAELRGMLRPRGIGCFLATRRAEIGSGFAKFLKRQRSLRLQENWDASFPAHVRTRLFRPRALPRRGRRGVPADMVEVPGAKFLRKVQFRVRECGFYESFEEKPPGTGPGLHQPVWFERDVVLKPYAMDLTPVTNAQFAQFLRDARYVPEHPERFLRHWQNGAPPVGQEDHPVVYVDLNDARAYAAWAGKRLPTEEEWQFAAQGPDGRKYPWGEAMLPERCNAAGPGTTPVDRYPKGRSPFGIYDLCGNTWEWTESERRDGVTRFCIIRGGAYYKAQGSDWYMDGGPCPAWFAAKFILVWPGLDRCATVGFRCATEA